MEREVVSQMPFSELEAWVQSLLNTNPTIDAVRVYRYRLPPPVQSRTLKPGKFLDLVIADKQTRSVPFWDAYLCTMLREQICQADLYDHVMFHNGMGELHALVSREDLSNGRLYKFRNPTESGEHYALASVVAIRDGVVRHIPMMDFACEVTSKNTAVVRLVAERIFGRDFALFDSGGSYHGYGRILHDAAERVRFLGKALLFSPITDRNYIAHQLLQEMSSLRISSGIKAIKRI